MAFRDGISNKFFQELERVRNLIFYSYESVNGFLKRGFGCCVVIGLILASFAGGQDGIIEDDDAIDM